MEYTNAQKLNLNNYLVEVTQNQTIEMQVTTYYPNVTREETRTISFSIHLENIYPYALKKNLIMYAVQLDIAYLASFALPTKSEQDYRSTTVTTTNEVPTFSSSSSEKLAATFGGITSDQYDSEDTIGECSHNYVASTAGVVTVDRFFNNCSV